MSREFEASRMVDQASGLLGNVRIPIVPVTIPPHVKLTPKGRLLQYRRDASASSGPTNEGWSPLRDGEQRGLLDAFRRIRTAQDVLVFAQRYGVLGLCEHGLPASHNPFRRATYDLAYRGVLQMPMCAPRTNRAGFTEELIADWLDWVQQVNGLLYVADTLRRGKAMDTAAWEAAFHSQWQAGPAFDEDGHPNDWRSVACIEVSSLVETWLDYGDVRPHFLWTSPDEDPMFALEGDARDSVFGVIALQVMLVVARQHALVVCSHCGLPYLPERKPQRGRRNYCPECRELGIPARDRQAARRARLAAGGAGGT
jgi:hypothetical protein